MEFLKKHKKLFIIIGICLILFILMFLGIKNAFFSGASKGKYGNRLEGIENYIVEDKTIDTIKKTLMDTGKVKNFKYELVGRRMDFIIEVDENTDLITSRSFADRIAENFSDEIKAYYDIQVYLTCSNEESEFYPSIGYKHKKSAAFKWNL